MPSSHERRAAPPTARRRPGRPVGGQLLVDRGQLLEAAERRIRLDGPDATMEAIATEATVTKPILYRNVGDKDALVAALAERMVIRINVATAEALRGAVDRRDGFRRMIGAYLAVVDGDESLFRFVNAGGSSADRIGRALGLADRSAHPLAERLGLRPLGDPDESPTGLAAAHGTIGALQYATLWWLRDRPYPIDRLADELAELLWDGLGRLEPRHGR
jgi:AcrR family transcriptional regulator